jgi:hypothetical protein
VGTSEKKIGIVGTFEKKSELWELIQNYVNISKNSTIRFGIVGTSEKNRNYGNISIFYDSELWELILIIGIVGTYLRIGIVALIFRNYGTLPVAH